MRSAIIFSMFFGLTRLSPTSVSKSSGGLAVGCWPHAGGKWLTAALFAGSGSPAGWLFGCLPVWLLVCLAACLVARLVAGQVGGRLAGCLAGWLADWLLGRLVVGIPRPTLREVGRFRKSWSI